MYEQPSPGHRVGPALIAFLVLVAAAAGTVGYYGARRMLGGPATPSANGPTTGQGARTTSPNTSPSPKPGTSTTRPSRVTPTAAPPTTYPPGDPTKCPAVTETAVKAKGLAGGLELLVYIQVRRDGESDAEVWVCKNTDGILSYQGHVLLGPLSSADNGSNTLLLAEGVKGTVEAEGDGYKALNPTGGRTTEYHVTRTKLLVVRPNGDRLEYAVVNVYPT